MNDQSEVAKAFVRKEMARIADEVVATMVDPWVAGKAADVRAAEVISASPTRSGGSLQVRLRLPRWERVGEGLKAARTVAPSLRRWTMSEMDPKTKTWNLKSRAQLMPIFNGMALGSILATDDFNAGLRRHLGPVLDKALQSAFPGLRSPAGNRLRPYAGFTDEVVRDFVYKLQVEDTVVKCPGVVQALDALSDKMMTAALAIPEELYEKNRGKKDFSDAKRRLLKAMRKAMDAGLSDEEIESVKMVALAGHVMES